MAAELASVEPGVVAYACNPIAQGIEEKGGEFTPILSYIVRPCVLGRVTVAMTKHKTKSKLGRKGSI